MLSSKMCLSGGLALLTLLMPAFAPNGAAARDCQRYAEVAVRQQQANLANRCGYIGLRWHRRYMSHLRWCRIALPGRPLQEIAIRHRRLVRCQRLNGGAGSPPHGSYPQDHRPGGHHRGRPGHPGEGPPRN